MSWDEDPPYHAEPDDDEPFTEEEQAEVAEAQERIARGEGVPLEEA